MNDAIKERCSYIDRNLSDFWDYESEAALEAIIINAAVALALLRGEVEEKKP